MTTRLEIIPGPGTVARFGDVCVWAAGGASPTLVTFLIDSARNVGSSPQGGARIADHIGGVLAGRDPEPGVAFAAVGPGAQGTALLLHGAIQAWDGARWLIPQPQPGWLRTEVRNGQMIVITAHAAPGVSPAPLSDLQAGVVPGAGFGLLDTDSRTDAGSSMGTGSTMDPASPVGAAPSASSTGEATVVDATELIDALRQIRGDAPPGDAPPPDDAPPVPPPSAVPPGTIAFGEAGGSPSPTPLPAVGQLQGPVAGQPVVAGRRCPHGHFNHPDVSSCVTCGRPVDPAEGQVSGSRPPLGVLLADNTAVYRLDGGYLIGSAPDADPMVTGGRARPLIVESAEDLAPVHAEIRLTGWSVNVIDRGATEQRGGGPTLVLQPGEAEWTPLRPFVATALRPGAHVAVGSRVLSLISPWPIS